MVFRFIFTNNEYHEQTNERMNKTNEMQLNAPTKVFNLQTVNTTTTVHVIYDFESLIIIKWVGLGLVLPLLFRFSNDQMRALQISNIDWYNVWSTFRVPEHMLVCMLEEEICEIFFHFAFRCGKFDNVFYSHKEYKYLPIKHNFYRPPILYGT